MLKEFKFVLPRLPEHLTVMAELDREICWMFGGLTKVEGAGLWVGGGKLYDEPVFVYTVALDPQRQSALRYMVWRAAIAMKQIALYTVDTDGDVSVDDTGYTPD